MSLTEALKYILIYVIYLIAVIIFCHIIIGE